jgi:acyl-coenzyme A thioesterase PaaI-like protein
VADDFVTPERVRLTQAVRHLIDVALTAENVTEARLHDAADTAERVAAELGEATTGAPTRSVRTRQEMGHDDYLPRSPLVGAVSPMAPPLAYEFRDGRIHAHGVFHAAYEGPPGYVHGGWIALSFDEVLGMTNIGSGHPGMTGKLSVRYRRPTPLHVDVRFEGWVEQVDGRRIVAKGSLHAGDELTAEAEGLFVIIGPERALEYFGDEAYRRVPPGPPDPLP